MLQPDPDQLVLLLSGDLGTGLAHQQVDLRANPIRSRVDTRLDGDRQTRQQPPGVMSLEVVEVGGLTMGRTQADAVARPVGEVPTVAMSFDVTTHDVIHIADRKSTRLNSSHVAISYAVFCLKKTKNNH